MIVTEDPRELERDLLLFCKPAGPRFVTAEKRVRARTDDEWIIAAAGKDSALHRRENQSLSRPGPDFVGLRREDRLAEFAGSPHIFDLFG